MGTASGKVVEAGLADSDPVSGECVRFRVVPDFVFARQRVAVFVDGCFWHGCRWHGTRPQGNAAFWAKKLAGNKARDRRVNRVLRRRGWRVLRIWEHSLRDPKRVAQAVKFVNCALRIETEEGGLNFGRQCQRLGKRELRLPAGLAF